MIEEIKNRLTAAQQACPGEWDACCADTSLTGCHCGYVFDEECELPICKVPHSDSRLPNKDELYPDRTYEQQQAIQKFIANAPKDIEFLIETIENLKTQINSLKQQ